MQTLVFEILSFVVIDKSKEFRKASLQPDYINCNFFQICIIDESDSTNFVPLTCLPIKKVKKAARTFCPRTTTTTESTSSSTVNTDFSSTSFEDLLTEENLFVDTDSAIEVSSFTR